MIVALIHKPGCRFCQKVSPLWEEIKSAHPGIDFRKVNKDSLEDHEKRKIGLVTVPKFVIMSNNRVVAFGDSKTTREEFERRISTMS